VLRISLLVSSARTLLLPTRNLRGPKLTQSPGTSTSS
jgi:hypothetical protein